MLDDLIRDLQDWYAAQCDGDWEHTYGVEITTLDNPGWRVKIDLVETDLQGRPFDRIEDPGNVDGSGPADRWMFCYVEDDVWHGAGDETKLAVMLKTFLDWAALGGTSEEA